jgi:hypothetical protein
MNPVRQGICGDPREYAHSGSFAIDWTKGMAPIGEWVPPWKGNPLAKAKREAESAHVKAAAAKVNAIRQRPPT